LGFLIPGAPDHFLKGFPMIPKRLEFITPFLVMDVLERAQTLERKGMHIIHLEVGEPDFGIPECVGEALHRAISEGCTHYTHSLGDIRLREAICEHYFSEYRVEISPDRVVVTSGTSPAMLLLFSVLLERGDMVILSDPHYACYPNFIRYLEGVPVTVPVHEHEGFQLMPERVREVSAPAPKAILINSPANPTGMLLDEEHLRTIADSGPCIISDEIYHGLVYADRVNSVLEFTDRAFVLNGFSKRYAMTGLRLGYIIIPPEYVRPVQILQQNFFISANAAVQYAGIAALREAHDEVEKMRCIYDERRKFMIRRLRELGFRITAEPTGAFYVFVNASHLDRDSYRLAFEILEKAGVGVAPGVDFGSNGEGFLRFSYANSLNNIEEGFARLEKYLEERKERGK
jgi:aspartate/methionine/tyrosine aminotransferase